LAENVVNSSIQEGDNVTIDHKKDAETLLIKTAAVGK
jgi:hypothetical protein